MGLLEINPKMKGIDEIIRMPEKRKRKIMEIIGSGVD